MTGLKSQYIGIIALALFSKVHKRGTSFYNKTGHKLLVKSAY